MPLYLDLPLAEVTVAHFNPAKRVDRSRLTGLLLSIREHGILQPLVLTAARVLADGHRRFAAAQMLKFEKVPVAVYTESKLTAPELWVTLNSDTMNLSPAQWLAAVDAGLPLDTPGFPPSLKLRIERLFALVGRDQVSTLVGQGRSPMIIDAAERMRNYCDRKGDDDFLINTVNWLINTGNAWSIRGAMDDKIPPDVLMEAVEEGREIGRVWDIMK